MDPWLGVLSFGAGAILADGLLSWLHGRGWIYYEGVSPLLWGLLKSRDYDEYR
jgi:hypothetical protein